MYRTRRLSKTNIIFKTSKLFKTSSLVLVLKKSYFKI